MSWGQQLLVRVSQKRLSEVMHVEKAAVSHPLRMWCQAEWVGWYRVAAWVTVIRPTQTITQWQPLLSFSFLVGSGDGGHSCSWNFLGVGREWNYHDILDCLLLTCIFFLFFLLSDCFHSPRQCNKNDNNVVQFSEIFVCAVSSELLKSHILPCTNQKLALLEPPSCMVSTTVNRSNF